MLSERFNSWIASDMSLQKLESTATSACESASSDDGGKVDKDSEEDSKTFTRRKSETLEPRKYPALKYLLSAEDTVAAQKRRNKVFESQGEVGFFAHKVNEKDKYAYEYLSFMCKKMLTRAHVDVEKTKELDGQ